MKIIGVYSMGFCGYKIGAGDIPDTLKARFAGIGVSRKPQTYKIQYLPNGRAFIRPDGRRIYLDELMKSPCISAN